MLQRDSKRNRKTQSSHSNWTAFFKEKSDIHLLVAYKVRQFKPTLYMLKNSIQKRYQKAPKKKKKKAEFYGRKWDRKSFVVYDELCVHPS